MKKGRVVRIRDLSEAQLQRLRTLRQVSRMLDSALEIPGTSFRFGLDPIMGLVPGLGDLVSPLFTIAILWEGRALGLPRVVQLRMVGNVALDTLIGVVPVLGDLFDFAWKANDRNMALLERHAYEEHPATPGDWLFAAAMILILLVVAAIPFVAVALLLSGLATLVSRP